MKTFITVLGSSSCLYDIGNDTSSYLINNKVIIDTGWNLVDNIRSLGLDPISFETVIFTHMHHDHYLALPQFLFYWLNCNKSLENLTLIGPNDLKQVLDLSMEFLQVSRFYKNAVYPKCIEISNKEEYILEKEKLCVKVNKSIHPVDGRYYFITDMGTGAKMGFSGDTAYSGEEAVFFKGCDILVHECSLGGKKGPVNDYLHSDAQDAALAASGAEVKKLILTHYPSKYKQECINAAMQIFKGKVLTPVKGDTVFVDD